MNDQSEHMNQTPAPQQMQAAQAPEAPAQQAAPEFLDLSKLDTVSAASQAVWMDLYHPITDEKMVDAGGAWRIQVLGGDSKEFKRAISFEHEKAAKSRKKVMSLEKQDQGGINALAAITVGWENIRLGGKPLPFSRDNAVELYSAYPWIKEQVDAFTAERANFLKSAPTS